MIKLLLTNNTGTRDITHLVTTIDWSGDYKSAARSLSFDVAASPTDSAIPVENMELGAAVCLMDDNVNLFEGYIVNRQKTTMQGTFSIRCFDRGMYLKSNEAVYQFNNVTAEAAARQICGDFGIPAGDIVSTGVALSRNFIAKKLYDIIQTMYTLAAEQTGDKYLITFRAGKLCVIKKGENGETLVIQGGVNLMDAAITESIESLNNRVVIYEKDYSTVDTLESSASIGLYGVFQTMIRNSDDARKSAESRLELAEPEQKITVNSLGDIRLITGGAVIVQEPYTGIWGLFHIDADVHTWKRGQYYNKLTLNFKNIMDKKDAGEVLKVASGSNFSSNATSAGQKREYLWKFNPDGSERPESAWKGGG